MDHISNLCKVLVLCLTLSFASKAYAEPFFMQNTLTCDDVDKVLSIVKDNHNETLIWMGEITPDIFQSLWVNQEKQSWTIIAVNKALSKACLVSTGVGFADFMSQLGKAI